MNYRSVLRNITAFYISAAMLISPSSQIYNGFDVYAESSHSTGDHSGWQVWSKPSENKNPIFTNDGKYYLNGNVDFKGDKTGDFNFGHQITGNIDLCLNGKNFSASSSSRGFTIENGTVNIYNCQSTKSQIYAKTSGSFVFSVGDKAKLFIENCSIAVGDNWCILNNGCFIGKNCNFSGNNGISFQSNTTETQRLENSTFDNNLAVNITGSVPVEIVDCTIKSNSNNGINISNSGVTVSISRENTINGNSGYGINCNGNLEISGNNTITGSKGGIYLGANKTINITGALTNTDPISIVTAVEPTDDTPVVFTNSTNTDFNDPEKFQSFKSGYKVEKNSEGQLQLTTGAKKHSMNVTYTVEPSYTVTIPASINLQIGSSTSAEVKVENVCIPNGQNVNVAISSATPDATGENFQIATSSGETLDYTITKNSNSAVKIGDPIISAPAGNDVATTLTFTPPENYKYSGTYTGTITFTVSVS